jgi:hypothetical protein
MINQSIKFLTVYTVTRHFRGHEEGGWWTDHYHPHKVLSVPKTYRKKKNYTKLKALQDATYNDYLHLKRGNISSVLGGTDVSVFLEDYRHQFATKSVPHYC